ncbi:MAG: PAS domain-containing sensor histidine kinase [Treponema sp.]|jgi:signal transduction histidine kinase|nr:PAS domain-containing sensor histidine kinase [Treponema sp.]
MRQFIKRALRKLNKLTKEQAHELLVNSAVEIDRLETVLDSLAEGILVCDKKHGLIMANKCAKRFLPLTCDEPGPIWTLVHDIKVSVFLETALQAGDHIEDKEFNVENMDKERLLSFSIFSLVQERRVSGSLIRVVDVTEKRKKEAQMRRMESLASLTTLAAGMAHEIKNPLGSLSIHVQLIQKALIAHKEECSAYFLLFDKYLGVVNEEIDRLNRIVVDFLFAVRPMNVEPREAQLNDLIKDLADFVFFELEENHIECILDLGEIPLIQFDERYMKQALLNLIKNAIAAMPQGGTLSIKTRVHDAEVLLSVTDTGVGISEENISKIFEPYWTTKETGSGLGLTLVYKIIKEHQGEIAVKSKEGEGAFFTISLPIPQKDRRLLCYDGDFYSFT